jgi:hypothetical protein
MKPEILKFYEYRAKSTISALKKKGFNAEYIPSKEQTIDRLLELIDSEALVGCGGSQTLDQLDIINLLIKRGNRVVHHNHSDLPPERILELRREELGTDIFLTSANALSMDGELVNIDGIGNRIAAMTFGPKEVIFVVGINKITTDLQAAYERAQNIAAPINAIRLSRNTPCTQRGKCMNCDSPERICRATLVIDRQPSQTPTTVLIVGEILGY